MPFRRNPSREAAEHAYGLIVEQSRRVEFFTTLGVPDTLDGRFELICLHAFLYLHRLKGERAPAHRRPAILGHDVHGFRSLLA